MVDDTVAKAVAVKMPAIEMPTPRMAVSSGRPATTKERKVTINTSNAIREADRLSERDTGDRDREEVAAQRGLRTIGELGVEVAHD